MNLETLVVVFAMLYAGVTMFCYRKNNWIIPTIAVVVGLLVSFYVRLVIGDDESAQYFVMVSLLPGAALFVGVWKRINKQDSY